MSYLTLIIALFWVIKYVRKMRTFYIALLLVALWVVWMLNKPIPQKARIAREFTDAEIEYLEKSFDYAMETLEDGKYFDWQAAAVNGRISAGKAYESSQKATCRPYVEIARTFDAQKVDSGIGCKRSNKEGWCRVHGENPQSCALEVQESMLTKRARFAIMQGTQMLDNTVSSVMGIDPASMLPKAPHMRMPSMPNVGPIDTPSAPDFDTRDLRPPMPWDK